MDKMREEFEAWAALEGLPVTYLESCGFYDAKATELCWQAWQASRKALVVELPNELDLYPRRILRADIIKALDAAGVAYK